MSAQRTCIAVIGAALISACSPGLGDFCYEDSDCKPGLRCSGREGTRGVCTYPEGVPDLAPKPDRTVDAGPLDQSLEAGPDADLGLDLTPDQPVPDLPPPDLPPDLSAADLPPDLLPADLPGDLSPDVGGADAGPD